MNDFESRLRDDLARESVQADIPVDLGQIMDAGHRGLRRQTIGRASAGTAFVLVTALGGYGLTTMIPSSAIHAAGTPTPATNTPESPSTPGASNSPVTDGTPDAVLVFDAATLDRPESPTDIDSVKVFSHASGEESEGNGFTLVPVVNGVDQNSVTVLPGKTGPWYGDLGNGYSAALIKGDVDWHAYTAAYSATGGHGVMGETAPVGDSGWTAKVSRHDELDDSKTMTGMIWATTDGVIHSSESTVVPSKRLTFLDAGTQVTAYYDADLDTFGLVDADGQSGSMTPSHASSELWIAMQRGQRFEEMPTGETPTDSDARTIVAGLVPPGSTAPGEPAAGETEYYEMQMITFEGLDGEVFVGVAKSNRPITLTYTDSIGKAHTIK